MKNELKPHKLSNVQERKLLSRLMNCKPLSRGSSRVVFVDPRDSHRVVKVAVGATSLCQNKVEVQLWKDYGDENRLARIYEYGVFCIVMERMQECYDDDYCMEDDKNYELFRDFAYWLAKIVGDTSDNYQIGLNFNGEFKIYDYGFLPDISAEFQCGWANEICDYAKYLRFARGTLALKLPATRVEYYYKLAA